MGTIILILACIILSLVIVAQEFKKKIFKLNLQRQQDIINIQETTINNLNIALENYKEILKKGVTIKNKPIWLTDDLCREVRDLWNGENVNQSNPRVKATKIIQQKSLELDNRKLSLQSACDLIKEHCLNTV